MVAMVARSTETYRCTGRALFAGLRWLRGVQRLLRALGDHWLQGWDGCEQYRDILALGDHWLQVCGGCEEYSDLYVHWETIGLQGCRGCEEYSDLYLHWETIGCRAAVAGVQRVIPALGDHWLQGCGGC